MKTMKLLPKDFPKSGSTRQSLLFFFKQKTAYEMSECDWSSDVCSSDLQLERAWEIIKSYLGHDINGGINRGIAGNNNYLRFRQDLPGSFHDLDTIHITHFQVSYNQVIISILDLTYCLCTTCCRIDIIPFLGQKMANIL